MELTVLQAEGGPLRLVLKGRLDASGADRIEGDFAGRIASGAGDVVVDLSGVDFVGSLGIRLLIGAARQVMRRRGRFVICGAQPAVAEMFSTVALDDLIPVLPDADAALRHLRA
jgi:anti-anti-sigma factor